MYPTDVLERAYKFKFGIDIWDVLNNCEDAFFLLSADNEHIAIRTYGRGERMPGASPVIEKIQELSDTIFYCKGYIANEIYTNTPLSS